MKARTYTTPKEIRREVEKETAEQYEKIFRKCADELTVQVLATVIWTLMTNYKYNWGKKRIMQFIEALHDTEDMMDNPSYLHHRFSPLECEQIIKDKYGIDLRKEFPAKVVTKP